MVSSKVFLLSALLVVGCTHQSAGLPPPPDQPLIHLDDATCVSCGGLLDEAQLAQSLAQAKSGNPDAAFRVAAHYSSAENRQEQDRWEHRAAELGHPVAQYNQWSQLRDSASCADRKMALAWLERSAKQGFHGAIEKLSSFREAVKACDLLGSGGAA